MSPQLSKEVSGGEKERNQNKAGARQGKREGKDILLWPLEGHQRSSRSNFRRQHNRQHKLLFDRKHENENGKNE